MTLLDEYLEKAGIVKPVDWVGNFAEEPNDYYVPPSERKQGKKLPGCVVEDCYDKLIRDYLDRFGDRYKTVPDVMRAAIVHFVVKIIAPAMSGGSVKRAQSKAAMWRLLAEVEQSNDDQKMIDGAERLFMRAKFQGEKDETFELLDAYITGTINNDRQEGLLEKCNSHPIFGEAFKAYREKERGRYLEPVEVVNE
jgi:hypothetical protein